MTSNSSGLISRLDAIQNSFRSFLISVDAGLGSSPDVNWALARLKVHVSNKLLSGINVYAHANNRIFLHLHISVDWTKFELAIRDGDEYVFVGERQTPEDIQLIIERTLTEYLRRTRSAMNVTQIRVSYDRSRLADDALGPKEVDRLAEWVPSTPQDVAQRASFRAIRQGSQITPRSLAETSLSFRVGMSAPA